MFSQYIVSDSRILSGKPVFTGTRIPIRQVLQQLAQGEDMNEILKDYPALTMSSLRGAFEYAAYMCDFNRYDDVAYA